MPRTGPVKDHERQRKKGKDDMGKGFIMWMLGVPASVIIVLWVFGFLH
jgi:hypothetical protein